MYSPERAIYNFIATTLQDKYGFDLKDDFAAQQRVSEAAGEAIQAFLFSEAVEANIKLPFLTVLQDDNVVHFETAITRVKLAELLEVPDVRVRLSADKKPS